MLFPAKLDISARRTEMWFKSAELAEHDWRLVLDHMSIGSQILQPETRIFALALAGSDVHAPIITARHSASYR
jgi:hypothetical protein